MHDFRLLNLSLWTSKFGMYELDIMNAKMCHEDTPTCSQISHALVEQILLEGAQFSTIFWTTLYTKAGVEAIYHKNENFRTLGSI